MQLRRRQTELDETMRKMGALEEELGGLDVGNLEQERRSLLSQHNRLQERVRARGDILGHVTGNVRAAWRHLGSCDWESSIYTYNYFNNNLSSNFSYYLYIM